MSTNEEVINEEDLKLEEVTEEELADDSVDWKAKFQETHGKLKRATTKLGKLKSKQETEKKDLGAEKIEVEKKEEKSSGKDYGQLAYLRAEGIKGKEEIDFVLNFAKRTGLDLEDAVSDDYVVGKIKQMRDASAVEKATPTNSKRGQVSSGKDSVDYWIAKGEMPPADQPKLRREYVNSRMKVETDGTKFTPRSVVSS